MSEAKKRHSSTPEFKAKVALEALRGVKTINEIGQDHVVTSQVLIVMTRHVC